MSGHQITKPTDVLESREGEALKLKLTVVAGPDFGAELMLERGTYRIGKSPANDLALDDSSVSRVHIIVEVLTGMVRVTDQDSTNGAFCDGMRFTSIEAKPGAVLQIGQTQLKVLPQHTPRPALPPHPDNHFGELVGGSLKMREMFTLLSRISQTDATVLVCGETGTGKELCARAIHTASPRAARPFVVCDLAGVPPSLLESELFGHVKGAFTGADAARPGAFEMAHGGTLFLDEVGELPLEVQPRLLRALERRETKRVGSNEYATYDVRIVAATNRDLVAEMKARRFREDLAYRLTVVQVTLPPLRQRPEDVPVLIDAILERLGKPTTTLLPETRALLADYSWPGNVRELRNIVERAVHLGDESALAELPPATDAGRPVEANTPYKVAREQILEAFERDYITSLLRRCGGNVSQAARESGIHRVYLHRLIKKYGLPGG